MAKTSTLSLDQLKRAVQIHEEIEKLQSELSGLLGGAAAAGGRGAKRGRKPALAAVEEGEAKVARKKRGKRTMSAEAREKIAAAQRRRWAKQKKAAKE
ncbi:MAG TPA: hypothetical protein VD994_21590 [Prosthecobacter sp.]|nr:hypothetical protein [Prosthecobacter sp.]